MVSDLTQKELEEFSKSLVIEIKDSEIKTKKELNKAKMKICKKMSVKHMPTNADILGFCKQYKELRKLLLQKPVRSISGVAIVAVMVKPHDCPGKCIYCPSGINQEMPKSYTGSEPAAMRALQFEFNAYKQTSNRIKQLEETGHSTEKIELIIMGGSFLAMPKAYQTRFVRDCLNAITDKKAKTLETAKKNAEKSKRRLIGLTIETRPDYCKEKEVRRMLELGATRVEIGVQMPSDEVYKKVNRGHSINDVVEATQLAKDAALKVCYHIMPGIYGATVKEQMKLLKELFEKQEYMPDMLKIYPTLVIPGTELYKLWKKGTYKPLTSNEAADFIAELKRYVPRWVRVMRVQRDIPAGLITAGVKKSNLRQLVEEKMKEKGIECKCIRHREIGIREMKNLEKRTGKLKLKVSEYKASKGKEFFIEAIDNKDSLYGFVRLRIPYKPFVKEIDEKTALIRELHVYGTSLSLGEHHKKSVQHSGIGKKLMKRATLIAKKEGMQKIVVISGLGVREYYRKFFGYWKTGYWMCGGGIVREESLSS